MLVDQSCPEGVHACASHPIQLFLHVRKLPMSQTLLQAVRASTPNLQGSREMLYSTQVLFLSMPGTPGQAVD